MYNFVDIDTTSDTIVSIEDKKNYMEEPMFPVAKTLRLTKKQNRKLKSAHKKMKQAGKAKSEQDVIRHLIETYL